MPNITIPSHFDQDRFLNGCCEASELGLPPGVAPAEVFLHAGNDISRYVYVERETDAEGATTAWVYAGLQEIGKPAPAFNTISILND